MSDTEPSTAGLSDTAGVRGEIERFRADYAAVRAAVARVIVGHDAVVDGVLTSLFADGHVLLEGVPGLGKTLLVRTLAAALHLSFSRVQFTPDLMPADVTGTTIVMDDEHGGSGGGRRRFEYQRGPVFAQILLADEINRATPKTQSSLLEAMQERGVTVAGVTHPLPRPFLVMATQNPIEQEGTYPLPEAQLDRFFFKLLVGSSNRRQLAEIVARTTGVPGAAAAGERGGGERVINAERIIEMQALVRRVAIAEHVADYAVRLVLATHPPLPMTSAGSDSGETGSRHAEAQWSTAMVKKYVRFGASPRAAQALVLGGKVRALVEGRPTVSISDIQQVAAPALRHRLILNFEAQAEGVTPDAVIANIVATLPVSGGTE